MFRWASGDRLYVLLGAAGEPLNLWAWYGADDLRVVWLGAEPETRARLRTLRRIIAGDFTLRRSGGDWYLRRVPLDAYGIIKLEK